MDVKTALTIICPKLESIQINNIREKYDKAYPRWMPHINLIFPFVTEQEFEKIKDTFIDQLKNVNPFTIKLNKISFFPQKQNVNIHLLPHDDSNLQELYLILIKLLPNIKPNFYPHLTLGQMTKEKYENIKTELYQWISEGFEFTINEICLIKRYNNNPFEIKEKFNLKCN